MKKETVVKYLKEYLLEKSSTGETLVVEGSDRDVLLFLNLLYMTPGTIPDEPNQGIDFNTKYKFKLSTDETLAQLSILIMEQTSKYLPGIINNVVLTKSQDTVSMKVTLNSTGEQYVLKYSVIDDRLDTQSITIDKI